MDFLVLRDKISKRHYMSQGGGTLGDMMLNAISQVDIDEATVEEVPMTKAEYYIYMEAKVYGPERQKRKADAAALKVKKDAAKQKLVDANLLTPEDVGTLFD